ncbi:FecR domain-containing protein [Thauera linaloolentis]|uniref:Fec operon regulator FecR n=1 Tax=Thauera linaloolentis (strain DSM 12138 / JCM 21573 / CCUG 41526 / CIP 105981 / IAM 15112 / NBRC 102519 / 47Lol) TaxID=1123367 RepID=N6Z7F4_THAL4|nr:FecR domain-containing protein [Thauera linaloolentis]ENO90492.1 fec operon regulator FecR [Thauera linaloolentis 47Lol = DSM 12138]MCM8566351.1 FecR domain-containing protein [Thauera linaloolentis]
MSRCALPRDVLEAAAHWYVQLNDEAARPDEHAAWERWLAADATHREAWERMQALEQRLNSLPGDVAQATLGTASAARAKRRRTVKLLTLLLSAGTVGALLPDIETGWRIARADQRTGTGERRRIELADGGTLDINTASAVDIDYGPDLRLLRLLSGEIMVQTANDPRPFEVHIEHGAIRALRTRFSVRRDDGQTHIAVFEHAVEIRPHTGPVVRIDHGQQTAFSAHGVSAPAPLEPGAGAWRDGKLIALDRRLDDFLAELERHRPGRIACAPEVAGLRLSGTFRLHDTDAVLETIAESLPVRLRHLTRYWVKVEAAREKTG